MFVLEIYNTTRQVVLAEDLRVAFDFWSRLRGLMGKHSLPIGEGLLLKPCNCVHSFFMSFSFDAVFLDEEMVIVHIIEAMPPFRWSPIIRKACSVLELPSGVTRWSGSRVGDKLSLRICFS